MTVQTEARNATLGDLAEILKSQQAAKLDFVAPANTLRSKNGLLTVKGAGVELTEEGVTTKDGTFRPTAVFDEGISDKLGIPLKYVRTLRNERPDLYDANVNGLLHGRTIQRASGPEVVHPADQRSFLVRTFRGDDNEPGVARALLSDSYGGVADNFDALTAALDGVRQAGVEIKVETCDLTERRLYVAVSAPAVSVLAPELLKGYRSPYSGKTGTENPVVFGGFIVSNSETGDGAFSITARLVVEACSNGLKINKDVFRAVHLGSKLESGIIKFSADTQAKNLALITAKARDAVATFLDVDYVRKAIAALETQAGHELSNPDEAIKIVAKKLAFSDEERAGVLDHFIRGGQITAGGVLQAVTSFCQTIPDADAAHDLEGKGVAALELAASL